MQYYLYNHSSSLSNRCNLLCLHSIIVVERVCVVFQVFHGRFSEIYAIPFSFVSTLLTSRVCVDHRVFQ